ncbi:MAG: TetR/AcrR family transcriptional regulator [Bdellovibrionales bacterium]|nr:TetR/AcrR family transcriptional regulator [Bdellovibrionales bacterium]
MARTKEFDTDKAIDQALEVFWQHGYHKASLAQLTEATGLHKGSLYGAFKSKDHLFQLCLDRYISMTSQAFSPSGLSAREYIAKFFEQKLNCSSSRKKKGCLLMNSSLELAGENKDAKRLSAMLAGVEANLRSAVETGVESGEIAKSVDSEKMAQRLLALAFTIEEMGKLGKDKDFLVNIANGTLKELKIEY